MTLRRILLIVILSFFCWQIFVAVSAGNAELVDALVWAVVIVLMLPMDRFNKDTMMQLIDAWKGRNKEIS